MALAHVSFNTIIINLEHRTTTNLLPSQWRLLCHGCGQLGQPERATPSYVLQLALLAPTAASRA